MPFKELLVDNRPSTKNLQPLPILINVMADIIKSNGLLQKPF
jgi:hypothetical protein